MDRNVMIVRDPERLRQMFASANIMQGFDPSIEEQKQNVEKVPNIIKIPLEVFEDFKELNEENENFFEYVATEIVIHSEVELDKVTETSDEQPRWDICLEFPDNICTEGRSKLHDIGNYFGLAHHSVG